MVVISSVVEATVRQRIHRHVMETIVIVIVDEAAVDVDSAMVDEPAVDDADSGVEADGNYMMDGQQLELALFMDTKVRLDNQASQSVFRNADLLHDLTAIKPWAGSTSPPRASPSSAGVSETSAVSRAALDMRQTQQRISRCPC